MDILFDGKDVEELVKALERAGETIAIRETDKKIVQRGADYAHPAMTAKVPRAADHSKSGRGYKGGGKLRPSSGPAANNVPKGKPKAVDGGATAKIGWTLGDTSEYFYMKFVNWGTLKMPPRDFITPVAAAVEPMLPRMAEEEYQKTIEQTLGRFT